jgi:hypothetical protein
MMSRYTVAAGWVANPAYGLWAIRYIPRQVRMRADVPRSVPPKKLAKKKARRKKSSGLFVLQQKLI